MFPCVCVCFVSALTSTAVPAGRRKFVGSPGLTTMLNAFWSDPRMRAVWSCVSCFLTYLQRPRRCVSVCVRAGGGYRLVRHWLDFSA